MKIFFLGVFVIILLGVVGFVLSQRNAPEKATNNQPEQEEEKSVALSEFQIEDIVLGEGIEATAGKNVVVHYTGTLIDGNKFDSSLDRGTPFEFILGAGQVIQGWDQGVQGMKVGGKRKLTIPPDLAYGKSPGHRLQNETLIFEIELLDVKEQ